MDYNTIRTPGVYIDEIPHLPASIVSVETAIPVFIGYTEIAKKYVDDDLIGKYMRITSLLDYQTYFGGPPLEPPGAITVNFDNSSGVLDVQAVADETKRSKYLMQYSLQMFYTNGGGACYIHCVGKYTFNADKTEADIDVNALTAALDEIAKEEEITLIVFPDAMSLKNGNDYYNLHMKALQQCVDLQNRFLVMDVYRSYVPNSNPPQLKLWGDDVDILREAVPPEDGTIGMSGEVDHLKYVAVYFPRLYSLVTYNFADANNNYDYSRVSLAFKGSFPAPDPTQNTTLDKLKAQFNSLYNQGIEAVDDLQMLLPASSTMVGIYTQTDDARGVWKAPANVNIQNVVKPEVIIANVDQDTLNVDQLAGKSINAIRYFTGRGNAIVWGARTLAGNDNEWRYVPVRRFFIMAEQSIKNATEQFVFEPNDEHTWLRVRSMIEIYLTQQWKAGALMGSSTKEAFFVHVGLGQTMTEDDIWNGRLIVQVGMAVVRPAEFIILQFMHKMLSES